MLFSWNQDISKIYVSQKDRNNTFHTKPSDIKKAPIRSEPSKFSLIAVIIDFPTRGFSVLCSNDSVKTGPSKVTVFVWTIRSAMDWRDEDYQSLVLKKVPTLMIKHIISELKSPRMSGSGKPKFIFVWPVWVENKQPMTDKVETNFWSRQIKSEVLQIKGLTPEVFHRI